jgi:hypothetical protein
MTTTYHGSQSLGACVPLALQTYAALQLAATSYLADVVARITANTEIGLRLTIKPPDVAGAIVANTQIGLQLAATFVPPGAVLQAAGIAELLIQLNALKAQLEAALELDMGLSTGGIHLYGYTGRSDEFGPQIRSATMGGFPGSAPGDSSTAVVLAATAPTAQAALGGFFGITSGG